MIQLERQIQRNIVSYLRVSGYLVFAVPNGGSRNIIEASNLKKDGVLAGVSDLIVISDEHICFMEVKVPKGSQSPKQKDFQRLIEARGFDYVIVRSIDDAIEWNEEKTNQKLHPSHTG